MSHGGRHRAVRSALRGATHGTHHPWVAAALPAKRLCSSHMYTACASVRTLRWQATRQLTMRTLGEAALGLGASLQESSLTFRATRSLGRPRNPTGDAAGDAAAGDAAAGDAAAADATADDTVAGARSGDGSGGAVARDRGRLARAASALARRARGALRGTRLARRLKNRLGRSSVEATLLPREGLRWGCSLGWRHSACSRSKVGRPTPARVHCMGTA